MKRLILPLALSMLALCGCASQYVMKLSNGVVIETASKPKLKGYEYHWKDAHGNDNSIPQSRVHEILPASDAKEENKFKVSKPKQHWWQFWR